MKSLLQKLRRWSSRTELLAVSDDDLELWLGSLGILEALQIGEVKCFVCGKRMTLDTVQLVSRVQGEIVVCCASPGCVQAFAQLGGKEKP